MLRSAPTYARIFTFATSNVRQPYSYRSDPAVPSFSDEHPVIIFDGYCALCSGWANFVLRHDHKARYRLLSAQSPLGRALYIHYGLDPHDYETNILIEDGVAWFKSRGSIRMVAELGWPWSLVKVLRIVPPPLMNLLYGFIAKNRLRLFGKRETCYLPPASYANRFLQTTEE